jgi:signal transduction histidine kinase
LQKVMRKRNRLYVIVGALIILLLGNIFLTYLNNQTIASNRALQLEIATIKQEYDKVGKDVIHALDIGLRGFAVTKNPGFAEPLYNGIAYKDTVLTNLRQSLEKLGYADSKLTHLRDSLDMYITVCLRMKELIEQDEFEQFKVIYERNYGNDLWGAYVHTGERVLEFINKVDHEANLRYEKAVSKNLLLQVLIFVLCVPTLVYTAFNTNKVFRNLDDLRKLEQEKYKFIEEQNQILERKVQERTKEIELKNADLENEVTNRTAELSNTNEELLEQNSKLEQFTFTVAHNLRAPLTRIMGLANIIEITPNAADQKFAIEKMVYAARELDSVIRDLNFILENSRRNGQVSAVQVKLLFNRVMKSLEFELLQSHVAVKAEVQDEVFHTISPYLESVLLNLLSNAIKYRDPHKPSYVSVTIERINGNLQIQVSDNGLGIDLEKFERTLFGLYKRFHTHVDGKGLGLYLVKSQVLAMRGQVSVSSKVGVGTTFTVLLEEMQ